MKVTIEQDRYDELIEAERFLNKLYAAGVDSWEGYSEAQDSDDESEDDIYE